RNTERGGGVPDAGAVHVHGEARRMRRVGEGAHLLGRVEGAEFGALGDRDGGGFGPVLVVHAPRFRGEQLRGELAVGGRHDEQLQAGDLLRGATLVVVDVRGRGRDD